MHETGSRWLPIPHAHVHYLLTNKLWPFTCIWMTAAQRHFPVWYASTKLEGLHSSWGCRFFLSAVCLGPRSSGHTAYLARRGSCSLRSLAGRDNLGLVPVRMAMEGRRGPGTLPGSGIKGFPWAWWLAQWLWGNYRVLPHSPHSETGQHRPARSPAFCLAKETAPIYPSIRPSIYPSVHILKPLVLFKIPGGPKFILDATGTR